MKKLESRIWTTNEEEEEVQKEGGRGVCDMKAERLFKARKDQTGWEKTEEGSAVGVEEWQPNEGRSRGENLTRKERSENGDIYLNGTKSYTEFTKYVSCTDIFFRC